MAAPCHPSLPAWVCLATATPMPVQCLRQPSRQQTSLQHTVAGPGDTVAWHHGPTLLRGEAPVRDGGLCQLGPPGEENSTTETRTTAQHTGPRQRTVEPNAAPDPEPPSPAATDPDHGSTRPRPATGQGKGEKSISTHGHPATCSQPCPATSDRELCKKKKIILPFSLFFLFKKETTRDRGCGSGTEAPNEHTEFVGRGRRVVFLSFFFFFFLKT